MKKAINIKVPEGTREQFVQAATDITMKQSSYFAIQQAFVQGAISAAGVKVPEGKSYQLNATATEFVLVNTPVEGDKK